MTTLTLKTFAQRLGFKRASDARFQTLLKQWSIDGAIKVYQGGYLGHSTAHPKKILLSKPFEFFQERSYRKRFDVRDARVMIEELGFNIKIATKKHKCSNCKGSISKDETYATASFFLTAKLCPPCVKHLCEGEISIKGPKLIITEKKADADEEDKE
jgi:Zn finger protein HypA/HybF involved in hydrogenase expression